MASPSVAGEGLVGWVFVNKMSSEEGSVEEAPLREAKKRAFSVPRISNAKDNLFIGLIFVIIVIGLACYYTSVYSKKNKNKIIKQKSKSIRSREAEWEE